MTHPIDTHKTPPLKRRLTGMAAASVLGLAGFALAVVSTSASIAQAGTRTYSAVQAASAASAQQMPSSRSLAIPYGKSVPIDLPGGFMKVYVSDEAVVDALAHTQQRVLLTGKQPGQTNVFFYDQSGNEILNLDIRVERDLKGLEALIRQHTPGSTISVESYNNNIVLSGEAADASSSKTIVELAKLWLSESTGGAAGEVLNLMTVTGKDQVQLKVRIVEMQRSITKQMGIDFNAVGQVGDASIGLVSNALIETGAGFSGNLGWTNSGGGAFRSLTSNLAALESVGLVRTLAEPVLTTISGETANFLSGGEFPLLTNVFVDENGNVQREFEYKPFGVSLGFTPVVLSEGQINLNISAEVSEPTTEGAFETGGADILGMRVRRTNTVVQMPAGGSMVIAGLIREETRQKTDGTPGLKDVPGFGALFRSRDDQTTETELVIIVTPYLVSATHPDNLQTPLDGFVAANDRDAAYLGRLNKVYGTNGNQAPKGTLKGPFGHVVD